MGFRVAGGESKIEGLGFTIQGVGFTVFGLWLLISDFDIRVQVSRLCRGFWV